MSKHEPSGEVPANVNVGGQGTQVGLGGVQYNTWAARSSLDPVTLSALNPHTAVARLQQLSHDELVDLFARASPRDMARILKLMLEVDEALAVAALADLNLRKATELIRSLDGVDPWLVSLPEAAEAISRRAAELGWGHAIGTVEHVSEPTGLHAFVRRYEDGSIYWFWDFGAVPRSVSATLPVSIYLSEETHHEQVEAAVDDLLAAADLRIEGRDEAVIGSWFRTMRAAAKQAAASPGGREAVLTAAHVADTHLVLAQDAQVTAVLLQNLGPVLQSLQPTKDAVLRIGALLIVKVEWAVQVFQLTAAQQALLDHRPQLALSPHEVIAALQLSTEDHSGPACLLDQKGTVNPTEMR